MSHVVVDEVDTMEAIHKDMYVMIDFLCVGQCWPYSVYFYSKNILKSWESFCCLYVVELALNS